MKAIVFAAGSGQRLLPLTERLPKALVLVAGRPMIEYPLLLLRHYGIKEIIINLHHLGEKIEAYLKDGEKLGLQISYSREEKLLDTGGGLSQARAFLAEATFIAVNSDVMIDLNLEEVLAQHRRKKATATLVLREDLRADLYGPIELSADLRIQTFLSHQAPQHGTCGPLVKFMFTGVQVLEPKVFGFMDSQPASSPHPFSITKVTYPKMLLQGDALYGFRYEGFWQDLGTPERIREAEERLKRGEVRLHYL